jgi:CheY-like chemotaxis protein
LPRNEWPLARILRGEKLRGIEIRIRRIHADWQRVFSYGGMLVQDTGGQSLVAVFTISDITERRQAADLIHQLNTDLEHSANHQVQAGMHLHGSILLVEDGADNQRLLRMQLENAGGSVTSALNGQIAVDLTAKQTFDLILMDMRMPVMDGYTASRELRRRGVATPIIALTAHAMAEDRAKCLASGCTGYLTKPTDEDKLLKTVHDYLRKDYLGKNPSPAPRKNTGAAIAPSPLSVVAAGGGSNRIQSSHAGNSRIMRIMPEFVARLPGKVRELTDSLEHSHLTELQRLAHQLLGTCGGYGFPAVSEPAAYSNRRLKQAEIRSPSPHR